MSDRPLSTAELRAQIEKARRLARDGDVVTAARLSEYADALELQLQNLQDHDF